MTNAHAERALTVPAALRGWITGIESAGAGEELPASFAQVPDTATKLVVRVEAGGRRDALVIGPRTRASYYADADRRVVSCVQVSLRPGTVRPLLGTAAVDLVGRAAPLGALPAGTAHQLSRELVELPPEEMLAYVTDLLPDPSAADRSRTRLLWAAVDALSTRSGHAPGQVKEVARELAVSERQLRNLFAEGVGLSPKHYARIDRVRHVLNEAPRADWAELAAATGYYDQSHMTADFRTLMGVPPRSYFTGRLPEAQPCQAFRRA
ncbi:helix-turn-helix domain-containing protein [Streptomyces sp. NPDC050287]|uniref:helix-turn-helix domain-containing protein n=1 Tax=Streptomyces sp. NPDC050287 TaxID=3365608 RepID=UPI0037B116EA